MTTTRVDRAALVRRAMVEAVADLGLEGASMSRVADRAGVAVGTAYVHYDSKEELLLAAFVEVKHQLGQAAMSGVDMGRETRAIFEAAWRNTLDHLRSDPAVARFLVQVEVSPLSAAAHEALSGDDPLSSAAGLFAAELVDLPLEVLYDLSLAPAVRLAASGLELSERQVDAVIESCWRAVSR